MGDEKNTKNTKNIRKQKEGFKGVSKAEHLGFLYLHDPFIDFIPQTFQIVRRQIVKEFGNHLPSVFVNVEVKNRGNMFQDDKTQIIIGGFQWRLFVGIQIFQKLF